MLMHFYDYYFLRKCIWFVWQQCKSFLLKTSLSCETIILIDYKKK